MERVRPTLEGRELLIVMERKEGMLYPRTGSCFPSEVQAGAADRTRGRGLQRPGRVGRGSGDTEDHSFVNSEFAPLCNFFLGELIPVKHRPAGWCRWPMAGSLYPSYSHLSQKVFEARGLKLFATEGSSWLAESKKREGSYLWRERSEDGKEGTLWPGNSQDIEPSSAAGLPQQAIWKDTIL